MLCCPNHISTTPIGHPSRLRQSRTDNRVITHMARNHSTWAAMCRLRLAWEYPYRYITGIVTYQHELGGDSEDDYSHGTSGLIRRFCWRNTSKASVAA